MTPRVRSQVGKLGGQAEPIAVGSAPVLATVAGLALALGMLVYLADRPASRVALMPMAVALGTSPLFGAIGQWLPSFIHPLAFSLLSAACRASAATPAYGACVAWWSVNLVFEVGQHPHIGPVVVGWLQHAFGAGGWTRPLTSYLQRGTFDIGDLIAATLGALAAALVLGVVHRREVRHGH